MTFDPRASAEQFNREPYRWTGSEWSEHAAAFFRGSWEERNPLNTPGPFYGAATDTCHDGPPQAPNSLLVDENGQGFVWRQPRSDAETFSLITGCSSDPFSGWGWDGDEHWNEELIRHWWNGIRHSTQLLNDAYRDYAGSDRELIRGILMRWTCYLSGGEAEHDLRRYLFRLMEGHYPAPSDALPSL